jgi:hypothetical protein
MDAVNKYKQMEILQAARRQCPDPGLCIAGDQCAGHCNRQQDAGTKLTTPTGDSNESQVQRP